MIVRVKLGFRVLWMRKSEEGYKIIVIGLQRLGFDVKREPSVQPVIYSFSAVSGLRRTLRGFVVMGGLKLCLTLKLT